MEWHVGERVEAVRGKSAVIYCAEDMSVLLMERQGVLSGVAEGTASRDRADSAIIVYMRNIGLYDSKNVFIKEQQLSLDSAPKGAPSAHSYSPLVSYFICDYLGANCRITMISRAIVVYYNSLRMDHA